MAQVNLDELSSQPVEEQQDVMVVGSEEQAPVEEMQQAAQPAQIIEDRNIPTIDQTVARPLSNVERQELLNPSEGVYPSATAPKLPRALEQLRQMPEKKFEPYGPDAYYAMPKFVDRYNALKKRKKGQVTKEERESLFQESARFYKNNQLGFNLEDGATLQGRLDALNRATKVVISKVTPEGDYVVDPNTGKPMIEHIDLYGDEDQRVVALFEQDRRQATDENGNFVRDPQTGRPVYVPIDIAKYDSGIYDLYDGDEYLGGIDIGLQKMRRKVDNPIAALFVREETPEGGMSFFEKTMRRANPNISPARLAYMARKQAEAGMFSGIEGERTKGSTLNTIGFVQDIGGGLGSWAKQEVEDIVAIPNVLYNYFTGTPTAEITAAVPNVITNNVLAKDPESVTSSKAEATFERVLEGDLSALEIVDAYESFRNQYGDGVNDEEMVALYGYNPDAFTAIKRFFVDSIITGGGFLAITRAMAKAERADFLDFVRKETGRTDIDDPASAYVAIKKFAEEQGEDVGMSPVKLLAKYREENGSTKFFADFRARTLDAELQKGSVYRKDIIQPEIDRQRTRLGDVKAKLAELEKQEKPSPKLKKSLLAQQVDAEKQLQFLSQKRYIPPHYRNFFVDEGIANTFGGLGYSLAYTYGGQNETVASIAAFTTAIVASTDRARLLTIDTIDDFKAVFTHGLFGEKARTRRAGRKAIKALRRSPPELKEDILMFSERAAIANEELLELKFPKDYPDPTLAGQNVWTEDMLEEAFFEYTGMLTLRKLENDITTSTFDIQKDAGNLSTKLLDLEKNYKKQQDTLNRLAKYVDSMRYVQAHKNFEPNSESGIMVNTLVNFFEGQQKRLAGIEAQFEALDKKNNNDILNFFKGVVDPSDPTSSSEIIAGNRQLDDMLYVGMERFMMSNLPKDATLEETLRIQQQYFNGLFETIGSAFRLNNDVTYNVDGKTQVANNLFRKVLVAQKAKALGAGHAAFNQLRSNPNYQDIRLDLTDMARSFMQPTEGGSMIFDENAYAEFLKSYRRNPNDPIIPVENLRVLKYGGKAVGRVESLILNSTFENGAARYFESLEGTKFGDDLPAILEDMDVPDDATAVEKFFAFDDWFKKNMGDDPRYEDFRPRLGVDMTDFTHFISGLGASNNEAAWVLRDSLLDQAKGKLNEETGEYVGGFVKNLFGPKSRQVSVPGFADDYEKAREIWRERVVKPFQSKDSTIRRLSDDPNLDILSKDSFLTIASKTLLGEEGITRVELESPGGFIYEMGKIMGGPIDVTTEEGKALKDLLNAFVSLEVAKVPGRLGIQKYLNDAGELEMTPAAMSKLRRGLEEPDGARAIRILNNLTKTDPETGLPLLRDVNGLPLIDPKHHRAYDFDAVLNMGVDVAQNAVTSLNQRMEAISKVRLAELKDKTSVLRKTYDSRIKLAEQLRTDDLGGALIKMQKVEGTEAVNALRKAFIKSSVRDGGDATEAGQIFDSIRRDAVVEKIMNSVMKYGGQVPRRVEMPDGSTRVFVEDIQTIDSTKLAELMGFGGGTESAQAKAMRALLGDETFDNIKKINDKIFDPSSALRTQQMNVTGTSLPLSAESLLSRGTSFFRGVISLRWLLSEAAIRQARMNNYELTKEMLSNPKVGAEIMDMLMNNRFDLDARKPEFIDMLIAQMAKMDALQQYAAELSNEPYEKEIDPMTLIEQEKQKVRQEMTQEELLTTISDASYL